MTIPFLKALMLRVRAVFRRRTVEDDMQAEMREHLDRATDRLVARGMSPEDARLAVKNIGAALSPGGSIYIIGQILDDSRTSPAEAVWFNLNFINTFDAGESYTEHEHREWLSEAGFVDIQRAKTPLAQGLGLMTARKPG